MYSLSPGAPWKGPRKLICLYVVVSLCTLKRVPGEGLFCCLLCSLSPGAPWKGSQGKTRFSLCSLSLKRVPGEDLSVLCVVCPLVLGCQRKACLSCFLLFLKRLQGKACQQGLSHCMGQVNAQVRTHTFIFVFKHPSYTHRNPPPL